MPSLPRNFDHRSTERIATAVRRVEGMPLTPADQPPGRPPPPTTGLLRLYRLKLLSVVRDGAKWRWAYTVRVVFKSAGGHGGWTADSRFSTTFTAYNDVEDYNDDNDTGIQSGIQLGGNVTGILPIEADSETGLVVWGWWEQYSTTAGEFRFCVHNAPVVEC